MKCGRLVDKDEYKKEEVVRLMDKPNNYAVYRDRLIRRGILKNARGILDWHFPILEIMLKSIQNNRRD